MAIESEAISKKKRIFYEGEYHNLVITQRDSSPQVAHSMMAELTLATLGVWLRTWKAIKSGATVIENAVIPERKLDIPARTDGEPRVTIYNHSFDIDALSVTVQSHGDGTGALEMAQGMAEFEALLLSKMPQLFEAAPKTTPSPAKSQAPANTGQKDINNVDSFLNDPATHGVTPPKEAPKHDGHPTPSGLLPFRYFKRLAPNIIQLQEFKQGGGEKYEKSAIEATLPYDKKASQYDEGALVYYPITGEIQFKEGKYGKQAIIPTARGKVYVDATDSKGQEKPEWATLSSDFYTEYERLNSNDDAKLFTSGAVLVLKVGKIDNGTQWKNYYRVFQELPK